MKKLDQLQSQFLISIGIASFIPLILFTLFFYSYFETSIHSDERHNLIQKSQEASFKIDSAITIEESKLKTLAALLSKTSTEKELLENYYRHNSYYYKDLTLLTKDGDLLFSATKPSNFSIFFSPKNEKNLFKGKTIRALQKNEANSVLLRLYVPIWNNKSNKIEKILTAGIDFKPILSVLNQIQLAPSETFYFLSPENKFIYPNFPFYLELLTSHFIQSSGSIKKSDWAIYLLNNKKHFHARSQIGQNEWFILIDKPLFFLNSSSFTTLIIFISIYLLIITLCGVIGFQFINKMLHSIKRLQKAAKSVELGQLDKPIYLNRKDEIGELAHSFNQMVKSIQVAKEENSVKSKELALANEELKKQNQIKQDFLSKISHELKTPLTTLSGYIRFLKDEKAGPLNHEQYQGVNLADKQIHQLQYLIDQLLDLVKYESKKPEHSASPIYMQGVFQDCLSSLNEKIAQKEIIIKNRLQETLPLVYGDRNQLIQIASNLLENAIKYLPEKGQIILRAREHETFIEFSIQDNGPGIPEKYQEAVFKKFFRLDKTIKEHGFGLGLSIVKDLVVLNGGKIWLESTPGEGTQFFFILPKYRP